MCAKHGPASSATGAEDDPAADMLPDVRMKLQAVTAALGRCLQEMAVSLAASYGRTDMAPRAGETAEGVKSRTWHVVLHNDDVHTYDEVSSAIRTLCKKSVAEARTLTAAVDRDGDVPIKTGSLPELKPVADGLEAAGEWARAQNRPRLSKAYAAIKT